MVLHLHYTFFKEPVKLAPSLVVLKIFVIFKVYLSPAIDNKMFQVISIYGFVIHILSELKS